MIPEGKASGKLPASWVNHAGPAKARYHGQPTGGWYDPDTGILSVSDDPGNALHELVHQVQSRLPALDAYFLALHRRRTAGEKIVRLRDARGHSYPLGTVGRKDGCVEQYAGREYPLRKAHKSCDL